VRVLHFGDIHIHLGLSRIPLRAWFSRRMLNALPTMVRRRHLFEDAPAKVEALCRLHREEQFDLVVCSGDFVGLGTHPELAVARRAVEPLRNAPHGFLCVPGNHDTYLAGKGHRVEDCFADTLVSDLPESCVDGPWPVTRLVSPSVAVIALNSARLHPPIWDATGRIPDSQLIALRRLAKRPEIAGRFVFVLTHYAPRLEEGKPDRAVHRMVNAEDFLEACTVFGRGAILCGHVHRRYCARIPEVRLPIFCAGSATHEGRESFWSFDLDDENAIATPGAWDGERYHLDTTQQFRW